MVRMCAEFEVQTPCYIIDSWLEISVFKLELRGCDRKIVMWQVAIAGGWVRGKARKPAMQNPCMLVPSLQSATMGKVCKPIPLWKAKVTRSAL